MASDVRQQYIKGCEEAYKNLLGLESFPEYISSINNYYGKSRTTRI